MNKMMLFVLSIMCFSCTIDFPLPPPPEFPEKELEWITYYGWYRPENPERVTKAFEIRMHDITIGKVDPLKEGETIEERYPEALRAGDEKLQVSELKYCYNKLDKDSRTEAFFSYLKVRLYDKEGNILEEEFLRFNPAYADLEHEHYHFSVHIPYHKEGHRLEILKVIDDKETSFGAHIILSKEELISKNVPPWEYPSGADWQYQEGSQCHAG